MLSGALIIIIITGLFQATRPIANTNNRKLHKKHSQTHKHIYTVSKRKRKNTQKGKIRISLHHKTKRWNRCGKSTQLFICNHQVATQDWKGYVWAEGWNFDFQFFLPLRMRIFPFLACQRSHVTVRRWTSFSVPAKVSKSIERFKRTNMTDDRQTDRPLYGDV